MAKPDLYTIPLKELRAFVLDNREDDEAFYVFVDRMNAEGKRTSFPVLKSLADMENYPEAIEKLKRDSGRRL